MAQITINAASIDDYIAQVTISEVTECPICKYSIKPLVVKAVFHNQVPEKPRVIVEYLCMHCNKVFMAQYIVRGTGRNTYKGQKIELIAPITVSGFSFKPEINGLSPDFVRIYFQALHAETICLDELSGSGYRRALEFLVKDYAKTMHPEEREGIDIKHLSECVDEYIDDEDIRIAARSEKWISSDTAHYSKLRDQYDASKLKEIIDRVVEFIYAKVAKSEIICK